MSTARPVSVESVCNTLARARLLPHEAIRSARTRWLVQAGPSAHDVPLFIRWLATNRLLTSYQADVLLRRREGPLTLGQYRVLERISQGRMAGVYRAVTSGNQTVAIKVLPPAAAADSQILSRFQREAHNMVKLRHPNCARAFEAGQEGETHYLVMEYMEGETLADVLKRRGRLPANEAVRLVFQALQGLQHVHELGMVHRDLEPANLMLLARTGQFAEVSTQRCTVKILDIGLGRAMFDDLHPGLTVSGEALGTPEYCSPEQSRDPSGVDIRTDIYSLGCVLYHCLVGDPPFTDKNAMKLLIKHATERPAPLSAFNLKVPPGLQEVLDLMLAKDLILRYSTPTQAAQALRPFVAC